MAGGEGRADGRISHELLGYLYKDGRAWVPDNVPAPLMRSIIDAVESGKVS
jgi:hypothetical protein